MLRRCCRLCSRQFALELSSSGIASTSKVQVRQKPTISPGYHSSNAEPSSSSSSYAMYSTAVLDKHIHESSINASAPSEKETMSRSFWKGKARAVEAPLITAVSETEARSSASSPSQSSRQDSPSRSHKHTDSEEEFEGLLASGNLPKALLWTLEASVEDMQGTIHPVDRLIRRIHRIEAHSAAEDPLQMDLHQTLTSNDGAYAQDTSIQYLESLLLAFTRYALDKGVYRPHRRAFQKLLGNLYTSLHQQAGLLDWQQLDRIYAAVIAEFTKRKRWKSTIDISSNIYKVTNRWAPQLLEAFLEASLQAEHYDNLPTFATVSQDNTSISSRIYSLLITTYLAARQIDFLRQVLHAVQTDQSQLDPAYYAAIVRGYRLAGLLASSRSYVDALQELMQITNRPPSELLNGLIQALIREGELEGAHTAYELFHIRFRKPRPLPASLPAPTPSGSNDILQSSPPFTTSLSTPLPQILKGLIPTAETFSSFVSGYTALGNLDQALDYYADMIDQGYTPAPFLSTALLQAFQKHGRPADDLLSIIQQVEQGTTPARVRQEVRSPSVSMQARQVLAESGVRGFRIWLEKVASQEQTVETAVISELLHYLRQTQQMSALSLTRLARQLRRSTRSPPTLADLNILLQALSEREARNSSIRKLRFERDGTQASILPIFQGSQEEMKPYVNTVKQLCAARVEPDARTVTIIMQRFADNSGSPRTLWQYFCWQILDRQLPASPHHISALMTAYIRQGDIYGARRALDRGQALGIEPNLHHYTILVDELLRRNQSALAEEILLQMQNKGIYPDLHIFGILANWAAHRGKLEQVHDLIRRACLRFPEQQRRPNVVLQSSVFLAHNTRREFVLGQHQLKDALSKGTVPDRQLLHMNARLIQDMGRNLRLETGKDLAELKQAIPLAKQNQLRMMRKLRAAGRPYHSSALGRLDIRELQRVVAVFGRGRNRARSARRSV